MRNLQMLYLYMNIVFSWGMFLTFPFFIAFSLAQNIKSFLNKENIYQNIFNPKRNLSLDKIKNITLFNIRVSSRYIINKINPHMSYYDDNVKIKMINGKRCGVYIDENKKEHIVSNICPHMKCNLVFNYLDKTWDCPCHASRFDIDGNLINGPSVFDIKIK